jgi:hypothetical protein
MKPAVWNIASTNSNVLCIYHGHPEIKTRQIQMQITSLKAKVKEANCIIRTRNGSIHSTIASPANPETFSPLSVNLLLSGHSAPTCTTHTSQDPHHLPTSIIRLAHQTVPSRRLTSTNLRLGQDETSKRRLRVPRFAV